MLAFLLSHWAPSPTWIDAVDSNGRSALHFAACSGENAGACVEVLVARGASTLLRDSRGVTPLGAAQQARQERAAAILQREWERREHCQQLSDEETVVKSKARGSRRQRKAGSTAHPPGRPSATPTPQRGTPPVMEAVAVGRSADASTSDEEMPPSLLDDDGTCDDSPARQEMVLISKAASDEHLASPLGGGGAPLSTGDEMDWVQVSRSFKQTAAEGDGAALEADNHAAASGSCYAICILC
jgi:hypothetical protein